MLDIGLKVLIALLCAAATGAFGWLIRQVAKMRNIVAERDSAELRNIINNQVDCRIEPMRRELTELKEMLQDQIHKEDEIQIQVVAGYKFRLMHLCKIYIGQGYVTQDQYDQLSELYKLYTLLGGNGQAKNYYERACNLPIVSDVSNQSIRPYDDSNR